MTRVSNVTTRVSNATKRVSNATTRTYANWEALSEGDPQGACIAYPSHLPTAKQTWRRRIPPTLATLLVADTFLQATTVSNTMTTTVSNATTTRTYARHLWPPPLPTFPGYTNCQRGPMPNARHVCPTFLRIQECDGEGLCPPSPSSLATNLLRMQERDGEGFFPPSPSFLPTFAVHLWHYLSPYAFRGHSNVTARDYSHPCRLFCPTPSAAIRT